MYDNDDLIQSIVRNWVHCHHSSLIKTNGHNLSKFMLKSVNLKQQYDTYTKIHCDQFKKNEPWHLLSAKFMFCILEINSVAPAKCLTVTSEIIREIQHYIYTWHCYSGLISLPSLGNITLSTKIGCCYVIWGVRVRWSCCSVNAGG